MTYGNNNAFTSPLPNGQQYKDDSNYDGLTKREYFAAMAMQGLLSSYSGQSAIPNPTNLSKHSVVFADSLIKQLNEPQP